MSQGYQPLPGSARVAPPPRNPNGGEASERFDWQPRGRPTPVQEAAPRRTLLQRCFVVASAVRWSICGSKPADATTVSASPTPSSSSAATRCCAGKPSAPTWTLCSVMAGA